MFSLDVSDVVLFVPPVAAVGAGAEAAGGVDSASSSCMPTVSSARSLTLSAVLFVIDEVSGLTPGLELLIVPSVDIGNGGC